MKKLISIFLLSQAFLLQLAGQVSSYQPGEKVNFVIHYGAINAGIATLELRKDSFSGREVWHSAMEARTTGIAEALFRVKDIYESYMNPESGNRTAGQINHEYK